MRRGLPAIALALCLSAAAASAADPLSVKVDGAVLSPQSFTLADLKAMPSEQVTTSVESKAGGEKKLWTGVLLTALLQKAGLKNETGKNAFLRHTLMVHGKDGYEVAIAIGEIEPMSEAKHVILAYKAETDLSGLRVVIPGDLHGARQVHDVVEIEIK